MLKNLRAVSLYVIAILVTIALGANYIPDGAVFWFCVGLIVALVIVATCTLEPVASRIFRRRKAETQVDESHEIAIGAPEIAVVYECNASNREERTKPIVLRHAGGRSAFNIQLYPIENGDRTAKFEPVSSLTVGSLPAPVRVDVEEKGRPVGFLNDFVSLLEARRAEVRTTEEALTPITLPLLFSYEDTERRKYEAEWRISFHYPTNRATVGFLRRRILPG